MKEWDGCQRILCVRADNMGDVLMSSPAFRALKESFKCEITLLTSSRGADVACLIPEIDNVISFDFPWVQVLNSAKSEEVLEVIDKITQKKFDACIVFSVYSQSSLPAAFMVYLAGVPLRLGYCRENPYGLLTHWIPDKEPYSYVLHQVERDLNLVGSIGAKIKSKNLSIHVERGCVYEKLEAVMGYVPTSYFVFHPGVTEQKRRYPIDYWVDLGKSVLKEFEIPILFTGNEEEIELTEDIASKIGEGAVSLANIFTLEEVAWSIGKAQALIAVNTGTVHIAAAMQTPVLVLYAQTNPQHSPWMVDHECLEYSVPNALQSRNEVIRFVNNTYYDKSLPIPSPEVVLGALRNLLVKTNKRVMEDLKKE